MAPKGRNKSRTAKNALGAAAVGTVAAGAGLAAYEADSKFPATARGYGL